VNSIRIRKMIDHVQIYYMSVAVKPEIEDFEIPYSTNPKIKEIFHNLRRTILLEESSGNFKYIQFSEYKLLLIHNDEYFCFMMINKDDSQPKAKIIAYATIRYLKVLKEQNKLTKTPLERLIIDFITNNFLVVLGYSE